MDTEEQGAAPPITFDEFVDPSSPHWRRLHGDEAAVEFIDCESGLELAVMSRPAAGMLAEEATGESPAPEPPATDLPDLDDVKNNAEEIQARLRDRPHQALTLLAPNGRRYSLINRELVYVLMELGGYEPGE